MKTINQNTLAETVVAKEGKKQSLSIAQVKEVQGIVLDELAIMAFADLNVSGVMALLEKRYGNLT